MTEILQSKIMPPRLRRATVARHNLYARLDAGVAGSAILVSAPAGYGKSTLVADWIAARRDVFDAAWLTLEAEDNNASRFVTYLAAALESAVPELSEAIQRALASRRSDRAGTREAGGEPFIALLNALAARTRPIVIVIDDYHLIVDYSIHKLLFALLTHLPQTLTLAIVTRMDPPLPLARLRSQGTLATIRASDLRFVDEEASEFLSQVMELVLDQEQISLLLERTEGWVTGLQLAGLSLQQHGDVQAFLEEFAGDNHNIRSYLVDEVLAGQPVEVQRFLLATSVLTRLTAPLCEAVLQASEAYGEEVGAALPATMTAQQILEYLEQHNLFVTPLDEHGQWYRYHPLFAELLRFNLWRENQGSVAALQRRAAQWLETNGLSVGPHRVMAANNGHAFVRGERARVIVRRASHTGEKNAPEPLSEREKDVLELLANDLSYQEIADRLYVSLPTVKTHVTHIYGKLGVHTREEALERARAADIFYRQG